MTWGQVYCGHIWMGSVQSPLSYLGRVRKHLDCLGGDEFFPTLRPISYIASHLLLSLYFHGRCSRELHNFVPPLQAFSIRIQHDTHTESIHTHFFHISLVRWMLQSDSFAPRTVAFWKELPTGSFLDRYNLDFYKSNVNVYLSYIF